MLINEIREDCYGEKLEFKVQELKPLTYYIVEIKFKRNNPIHRCIMATGFADRQTYSNGFPYNAELFSRNYEGVKEIEIKNIYWFKVIQELPNMRK